MNTQLTEEAIKKIVDGMPGGIDAFCTDWGWLQFARKIEEAHGITKQTTTTTPPTIKAGQRLLIKEPYPINPYEVHVIETVGEYAKIQGDSDQRGFWEKIELITPYVIHVLGESAEPKELDEDHHSMMNRSRINQSLPKDYIDALIKAADPRPSMADAVRNATKKPE